MDDTQKAVQRLKRGDISELERLVVRYQLNKGFSRLRKRPDILLGFFQHTGLELNQLW